MCNNCQTVLTDPGIQIQKRVNLDYSELEITNQQIQTILGFKDKPADEPFPSLIDECLEIARINLQIKVGLVEILNFEFDSVNYSVITHDILHNQLEFFIGKKIYNSIKKSEMLHVFVCTAGKKICDLSKKKAAKGDSLRSYILDIIGSEIVEAAMDKIQNESENFYRSERYNITNRYSPGYCDWPVSEQQKLFKLIPHNFCGVSLTTSSLMIPAKSISGIIGIGENVKRKGYGCSVCESENCIYKRLKD